MGGRLELVSSQAHTLNNPVYFLNCNIPANPINPPHLLLLVPSLNSLFESPTDKSTDTIDNTENSNIDNIMTLTTTQILTSPTMMLMLTISLDKTSS